MDRYRVLLLTIIMVSTWALSAGAYSPEGKPPLYDRYPGKKLFH